MKFLNDSLVMTQEQWIEQSAVKEYLDIITYLCSLSRFDEAAKELNKFLVDSDITLYIKYILSDYFKSIIYRK